MAVFCKSLNLLFIENPCTGSTATSQFILWNLNGIVVSKKHTSLKDSLIELEKKFNINSKNVFKVIGVRNPFDVSVSWYHRSRDLYGKDPKYNEFFNKKILSFHKRCNSEGWSFEKYMEEIGPINEKTEDSTLEALRKQHYSPFVEEIINKNFDQLIYFENIDKEINLMIKKLSNNKNYKSRLPYTNATNKINQLNNYKDYYNKELIINMRKRLREYLLFTNYTFNGFSKNIL